MTGSLVRLFIARQFIPQDEDGSRRVAALLVDGPSAVKAAVDPDTPGAGGDGPAWLAGAYREGRALREAGCDLIALRRDDGRLMADLAAALREEP